jgi:hypothetical protein
MKHYNEVELLEHYYLAGGSPELQEHVAGCTECSSRYGRLREKLSCSADEHRQRVEARPVALWSRQRAAVLEACRRGALPEGARSAPLGWRITQFFRPATIAVVVTLILASAALLVFTVPPDSESPAQTSSAEPVSNEVATIESQSMVEDPWAAEELQPYGELVEWESWLTEDGKEGTS